MSIDIYTSRKTGKTLISFNSDDPMLPAILALLSGQKAATAKETVKVQNVAWAKDLIKEYILAERVCRPSPEMVEEMLNRYLPKPNPNWIEAAAEELWQILNISCRNEGLKDAVLVTITETIRKYAPRS